MIYVCTVHFQTDVWVRPQLEHLTHNMKSPFRVFACVPEGRREKDYYLEVAFEPASKEKRNHADKLNYLARLVAQEAQADDILVFLDGDAFPVARIDKFLRNKLKEFKFLAIQRRENSGDIQPHPSFAATTVGFWSEIGGDWNPGHQWKNDAGLEVTDTGGNLLKTLADRGIDWYPLLRSNSHDLHPLWFGIYDGLVYHHGAAYRSPVSRVDLDNTGKTRGEFLRSPELEQNKLLQERVLSEILTDRRFYKQFM